MSIVVGNCITKVQQFLGATLFLLFCWIFSIVVGVPFLPVACCSQKLAAKLGTFWGYGMLWGISFFCNIKYKVEGDITLEPGRQYVVVSKHQSTWETLFFTAYFKNPAFILKKELLYIPLFGLYLRLIRMIIIDRKRGIEAMRKIIRDVQKLPTERVIIVFPEGHRVKVGTKQKFQPGIHAIIKAIPNAIVLPVALNTGVFWPKGSFVKRSGTITVKFLTPVNAQKEHLIEYLESVICEESDKLL